MKIIGIILILVGLVISIVMYAQYGNFECHCPEQTTGKPSSCGCMEDPLQLIMAYSGMPIIGCGIALFVHGWRKNNDNQL